MMNRILFISLCLLFAVNLSATERDTLVKLNRKVQLISKHYEEEIVLRWAPTDEVWWFHGITEGFEISRRDLSDPNSRYEVLEHNFKPWTEDEMVNWYAEHPEDEEIIVPLQTIHRDWENTSMGEGGMEELLEKSTFFRQRHQMTILAADLHPIVADAAGLRFVDKSIDPKKAYSYRVRYNKLKDEVAYSIVRNSSTLNKPLLFEVLEKDEAIQLKWEKEIHQRHFTSYHIERSLDGATFERLNEKPYVNALSQDFVERKHFVYTDSVKNYKPYYYRIIGIDAFGDQSEPSDLVKVTGKDRTPPVVGQLTAIKAEDEKSVALNWNHADKEELGVALVYKNDYYEQAKLVCKFEEDIEFECIDADPTQGMNDYYLVMADTVGNVAQSERASVYFKDKFAPKPPTGLKADVDTMGRIILTWDESRIFKIGTPGDAISPAERNFRTT